MKNDDLSCATAREISAAVGSRETSALEVVTDAIARIETQDRTTNAVVVKNFDRAIDEARQVDRAVFHGERRLLQGVPITIKESFDVAGLLAQLLEGSYRGFTAPTDV
jgi:amidase